MEMNFAMFTDSKEVLLHSFVWSWELNQTIYQGILTLQVPHSTLEAYMKPVSLPPPQINKQVINPSHLQCCHPNQKRMSFYPQQLLQIKLLSPLPTWFSTQSCIHRFQCHFPKSLTQVHHLQVGSHSQSRWSQSKYLPQTIQIHSSLALLNIQSAISHHFKCSPSYNSIPRSPVTNWVHQSVKLLFPWLFQSTERLIWSRWCSTWGSWVDGSFCRNFEGKIHKYPPL